MRRILIVLIGVIALLGSSAIPAAATHTGDDNMDGYGNGQPAGNNGRTYCEDWGTDNHSPPIYLLCNQSSTPGNLGDSEHAMADVIFWGVAKNANEVAVWQMILWADGMGLDRCASNPPGNGNHVDGKFGPNTKGSTIIWQTFYQINAETDGTVGRGSLNRADNQLVSVYGGAVYLGRNNNFFFLRGTAAGWNDFGLYLWDPNLQLHGFNTAWNQLDPSIDQFC